MRIIIKKDRCIFIHLYQISENPEINFCNPKFILDLIGQSSHIMPDFVGSDWCIVGGGASDFFTDHSNGTPCQSVSVEVSNWL